MAFTWSTAMMTRPAVGPALGVVVALATLLAALPPPAAGAWAPHYPEPGPDIAGRSYCAVRPVQQCCPGRDDKCTMPLYDTLCYCDIFCNRTVADCCPDFFPHCMGTPHPSPSPIKDKNNCHHHGKLHQLNDRMKVNCNNCTCVHAHQKKEYNWKCTQKVCVIRKELLDHVTSGRYGWRPKNYTSMWGMTLDDAVKYRLGTFRPFDPVKRMTSLRVHIHEKLPSSFDSRVKWPDYIHGVRDQGNCGASWAFSTTSMAADRLAIHSQGAFRDALSPQHLLSCDRNRKQEGCEGGHLDRAWWFLRRTGVVSEQCYPYDSGRTSRPGKCRLPRAYLPPGDVTCPHPGASKSRLYQATPPYRIAPNEREIMKEIMENGPVQATLEVKEDLYMYRGGVYRYSLPAEYLPPNRRLSGFHSVRILGWGVDNSQRPALKYWICANSWGTSWGEDGYFRIAKGVNECKIESFVIGVWGKVNGRQIHKGRRHPNDPRRRRKRHHGNHKRSKLHGNHDTAHNAS